MKEHTFLITETGVEILTARKEDSPGGPIPMPGTTNGANGTAEALSKATDKLGVTDGA
jgi:hypothetical protein